MISATINDRQGANHARRKTKNKKTGSNLLSAKEKDVCRRVSSLKAGLASQRADALLAIDNGSTQAEASQLTGLNPGQIKYLMSAFHKKRLSIFPDDIVNTPQEQATADKKAKREKKAVKSEKKKKPKKEKKAGKSKKDKKKEKAKRKAGKKKKGGKGKKAKKKNSKKKAKK